MLQIKRLMHTSIFAMAGLAMMAFSASAFADEKPSFAPDIPEPDNGSTECVRPEDDMKKNHMNYILHQRDKTMHQGIRAESEKSYSLKKCINCHVPENSTARYGDDKHFCSSCHNFAGVSIDCFQCHMDHPMEGKGVKAKDAQGTNPHNAQLSIPVNEYVIGSSTLASSTAASSTAASSTTESSTSGAMSNEQ